MGAGRIVRINGERTQDLMPEKEDPLVKELCTLRERVCELEERSATQEDVNEDL